MEVRGSVIVGDVTDPDKKFLPPTGQNLVYRHGVLTVQSDMSETDDEKEPPESDGVPRIAVAGFKRGTKLWTLYSLFNKFGTVTYVAVCNYFDVVEFEDRQTVEKILPLKHLRHGVSRIKVEPLALFRHAEPYQLEFSIHKDIVWALKTVGSFERYVEALCENTRIESNPERDLAVCKLLETTLQSLYPGCKAHKFGSRVSGLGLPDCDLDIFLDPGDMYDGECGQEPHSQELLVTSTRKALAKSNNYRHIEAVPKARVPILRFLHVPTSTHCDVAFKHGLGVENTKLLVFLMSLDPRLRPMCMFVKEWAHLHEFRAPHKMGHFSSYALVMMVVFFFQQLPQPILPPISLLLAKHTGPRHFIAGWDCSFTTDKTKVPSTSNTQTLLELLEEFCKFYRTFDFEQFVICPLLGKKLEKNAFLGSLMNLPSIMHHYVKLVGKKQAPRFCPTCPVAVQDPFDLSHNITRPVKHEHLMKFISCCGLTRSLCARLH